MSQQKGLEASTLSEEYTDNMTDINQVTQMAKGISDYGIMDR